MTPKRRAINLSWFFKYMDVRKKNVLRQILVAVNGPSRGCVFL